VLKTDEHTCSQFIGVLHDQTCKQKILIMNE